MSVCDGEQRSGDLGLLAATQQIADNCLHLNRPAAAEIAKHRGCERRTFDRNLLSCRLDKGLRWRLAPGSDDHDDLIEQLLREGLSSLAGLYFADSPAHEACDRPQSGE